MERMTAAQYKVQKKKKPLKYRNKKTELDGHKFDSKKEAKHYLGLKQRERDGKIESLELQPPYMLIVNDELVCKYVADFSYYDKELMCFMTVDVKSEATRKNRAYRIKNKLFKAIFGRDITEV